MHKIISLCIALALLTASCSTEKEYLVTIHTPYGDMHAVLYDATPEHKQNFIELAQKGKYDSTIFHRVIEGFMVQGGDLSTSPTYDPDEDSVDYTIPAEFVDTLFHKKGALAAARQGDRSNPKKASSGSQFYIVQGEVLSREELLTDMNKLGKGIQDLLRNDSSYDSIGQELLALYRAGDFEAYNQKMMELIPIVEEELNIEVEKKYPADRLEAYTTQGGVPHLDDNYTVFGQVIDGLEVIDSIAQQPTAVADKPVNDIYMQVGVQEMSKKKITKEFGYQFPAEP